MKNSERIKLLEKCYEYILEKTSIYIGVDKDKLRVYYGLWIIFEISSAIRIIIEDRFSEIVDPLHENILDYEDSYYYIRSIDDSESYFRKKNINDKKTNIKNKQNSVIEWHVKSVIEYICNYTQIEISINNKTKLIESFVKCSSYELFNFVKTERSSIKRVKNLSSVGGNLSINVLRWKNPHKNKIIQHGLQQFLLMEYHPHDLYSRNNFKIVYFLKWMVNNNDKTQYPNASHQLYWKMLQKSYLLLIIRTFRKIFYNNNNKSITYIDYDVAEGQYPWSNRSDVYKVREDFFEIINSKILSNYKLYWKPRYELPEKLRKKFIDLNINIIKSYSDRRQINTIYIIPYISTAIYELAISKASFIIYLESNVQMSKLSKIGERFIMESGLSQLVAKNKDELLHKISCLESEEYKIVLNNIRKNLLKMTFCKTENLIKL